MAYIARSSNPSSSHILFQKVKVNTYPYQLKYFSIRTKDFQSYTKKYTMWAIELMPTMRYNSFGKSSCHHGY